MRIHHDFIPPAFGQFAQGPATSPGYDTAVLATPGLVAHYRHEPVANRLTDHGPHSLHAPAVNGPTASINPVLGWHDEPAATLDGQTQHFQAPDDSRLELLNGHTAIAWVRRANNTEIHKIVSRWEGITSQNASARRSWLLSTGFPDGVIAAVVTASGSTSIASFPADVPPDLPLMLAHTHDVTTGELTAWLNAQPLGSVFATPGPLYSPSPPLRLGVGSADPPDEQHPLAGDLDAVSLFDRPLSADELLAIYRLGQRLDATPA